jgi:Xaa-Pro dipeptidase
MKIDPTHEKHLTPSSEIASRHARLRTAMAEHGVDAVWIDTTVALYYLAGSIQSATLIVPAAGEPRYLVRKSVHRARVESPLEVEPFAGRSSLYEAFGGFGRRLGLDFSTTPSVDYLRILGALPDAELIDVSGMLRGLRMVKSDWEVAQIRRATAISESGFKAIRSALAPGASELEVSVAAEAAMRRAGHQGFVRTADPNFEEFGPSVASGDATMYPNNFSGSLGKPGLYPAGVGGADGRHLRHLQRVHLRQHPGLLRRPGPARPRRRGARLLRPGAAPDRGADGAGGGLRGDLR